MVTAIGVSGASGRAAEAVGAGGVVLGPEEWRAGGKWGTDEGDGDGRKKGRKEGNGGWRDEESEVVEGWKDTAGGGAKRGVTGERGGGGKGGSRGGVLGRRRREGSVFLLPQTHMAS